MPHCATEDELDRYHMHSSNASASALASKQTQTEAEKKNSKVKGKEEKEKEDDMVAVLVNNNTPHNAVQLVQMQKDKEKEREREREKEALKSEAGVSNELLILIEQKYPGHLKIIRPPLSENERSIRKLESEIKDLLAQARSKKAVSGNGNSSSSSNSNMNEELKEKALKEAKDAKDKHRKVLQQQALLLQQQLNDLMRQRQGAAGKLVYLKTLKP